LPQHRRRESATVNEHNARAHECEGYFDLSINRSALFKSCNVYVSATFSFTFGWGEDRGSWSAKMANAERGNPRGAICTIG